MFATFAQFNLPGRVRLIVRGLFALAVFAPGASMHGQDTRTVIEPTFPVSCTALAAQQAIVSGEPASESTLDTSRIQAALTACPSGQAVELTPGGTNNANNAFVTGPLNIPNGVTLVVDGGVTLFGSRNPADYQSAVSGAETCGTVGTAGNGCVPLIQVNNGSSSNGSGVMGFGIINGRGGDKLIKGGVTQTISWWDLANQANGNGAQNNPILLYAKNAANFTLYKISLLNSPMFHVKYQTASGLTIWGIKIVTPYSARNTDGVDPDDRISNITIANSYISDGDDNIALGASGSNNAVSNVTVSNLHTYSGHGVSIGSYTSGGVSNVYVNNVNMTGNLSDTNSAGLKIKSAQDRGGLVNNVSYNNVCIQNIRYPLQFNPIYNANTGTSYPSYQNIALHGVSIVGTANGQIQFQGLNANFPLGLTMDNLNITGTNPALTPAPQFANFTIGPGPVNPTLLQTIRGTGISYTGNITNPSATPHACPATNFPFLAGELYLSTPTSTNKQTLSLPNPATFTLNAVVEIVEAASVTPTSSIQFYEGTNQVGTAALASNGTLASVTLTNVTSGAHTYTARYPADSAYAQLNFGSVTVNVNTTATTTAMTATPTAALYGNSVALVATVTPSSGTVSPTGTVTFSSGSTVFGTATLNASGVATLNTSTLPVGNNAIVAAYGGSTNFATSNSNTAPVNVSISQAGTTTTVGAAPANTVYGGTVTLTSVVAAATSGIPTGSVTFMDGATILGTATLSLGTQANTGTGQLIVSNLNAGFHSITAVYGGDTNFTGSSSPGSAPETVVTASTATTIGFTAGSVPYGAGVTMVATINASTATAATGTVTFTDTSTSTALATVAIAAGASGASYTTSSLTVGTHNIVATYSGDTNYTGSSSAATPLVVTQASSTTTASATGTAIAYGSSDTFTATVSPSTTGVPSGTVTFKDGATVLATATLFGSTASFTTSTLTGGTHSITIVYSGDNNFTGSTSTALTVTVSAASTTTAVSVPAPITYGSAALLSATVGSSAAGTLTGTVTFKDGSTVLGTVALSGGAASYSATGLSGGTHSITATYSGDTNYATSASAASTLTVNKASTASGVVAATPVIAYGGAEALTASVTPATATGTFTFQDGGVTIGTGTISGGTASFTTSTLGAGTHSITAVYSGDTNYLTSASTGSTVTVNQASSTVSVSASPATVPYLSSTVLTANVTTGATGTVTFKDGGVTIGSGTLAGGSTTVTAAGLAVGTHTITATYSGDANFTGSTSGATTVTVNQAATTTTVAAAPTTVAFGGSTTLSANVSPASVTGTITFKDGATILGTATASAGAASLSVSTLTVGSHSITATYSGDANDSASTSAAITVTVSLAATTTTISAPATGTYGTPTLITVTVAPAAATGTVTFKDSGSTLGTSTVTNGVATFSASLAASSHVLTASYSGDANYAASATTASVTVIIAQASPTVTVTGNPLSFPLGSSTTLIGTMSPLSTTGAISFVDRGTVLSTLGTGFVANGTASLPGVVLFPAGAHTIVGVYSGDNNDNSTTSAPVTFTVTPGPSTVTLTSATASPVTYGTNVTLSTTNTTLLGIAPTGTVQYFDGTSSLGSAPMTINGSNVPVSTFSLATLMPGTHTLTAVYSGDGNYAASTSAPVTFVVNQANSTTTLAATPPQTVPGQTFTLTATAAGSASGSTPTGSITFFDQNGNSLGTVALVGGTASLQQVQTALGTYTYTASYSGDADFTASSSAASPTTVIVKQLASATSVAASPTSGTFGTGTYTVTAIVTPASGGPATGSVTFKDGATVLGSVTLPSNDTASLTNITLGGGLHSITATYSGDPIYVLSVSPTPAVIKVTAAASATSLSVTPATSAFGTSVAFSAAVTSTTSTAATGTVTFKNGSTVLGTGTVNAAGIASFSTSTLPIAVYNVTAVYSGDSNFAPSTSSATTVTVTQIPQTITLSSIPASATYGVTPITVTATASSTLAVSLAVTGPATLNGSVLTITGAGTVTVTATQAGNANYAAATPVVSTIVVAKAALAVTVANQSITSGAPIPTLTGVLTGVVNGDAISASYTTTATSSSAAGTYPITATLVDPGNRLGNYSVTNTPGTLTILSSGQTITFAAIPTAVTYGAGAVTLSATASSGLPVSLSVTGPATLSGSTLTYTGAGTVVVTATQAGNAIYPAATPAVQTVVVAKAPLTVTGANASRAYNTANPTLTGTLSGVVNGDAITATYATTATIASAAGTYPIAATLVDPNSRLVNYMVTSTAGTLTVTPGTTAVSFTLSAGTIFANGAETLTATVASPSGAPATGTVTFLNGAMTLGTGTVTNGVASVTLTNLTLGTYSVTASFAATTNYAASVSSSASLTVVAPVALTLNPSSLSLAAGGTGTSTLTVAPSSGFTGAVTLTCSSPVAYVTCAVTSPVTIGGTTSGTATVTINVAATYGTLHIPQIGPDRGPGAVALATILPFGTLLLLPLVGRRRKVLANRSLRIVALLLTAAGMSLAVTGCAGGGGSITPHLPPAGTQTVTIAAVANSTTVTTPLTVIVTN